MITYEIYKIIHLFFIVVLFTTLGLQVFNGGEAKKAHKMWYGIASLLILVSGMGLLARIGVPHAEPWANWIRIKLTVWLFLTIASPIILRRFPNFKKKWWFISLGLLLIAIISVQYKIA